MMWATGMVGEVTHRGLEVLSLGAMGPVGQCLGAAGQARLEEPEAPGRGNDPERRAGRLCQPVASVFGGGWRWRTAASLPPGKQDPAHPHPLGPP